MENIKYGRRREGRWTPIRAKAQDTIANPNSWETDLVRKRQDIGLIRALSPRIMMMMNTLCCFSINFYTVWQADDKMAKIICHIYIFHLISLESSHYFIKHKSTKLYSFLGKTVKIYSVRNPSYSHKFNNFCQIAEKIA